MLYCIISNIFLIYICYVLKIFYILIYFVSFNKFYIYILYYFLFVNIKFIILLNVMSMKSLENSNIFLPLAVVDAAIYFKYIGLTYAPIYPYNEFAVILYANCIPSYIIFINSFFSFYTFYLYSFLAFFKSNNIDGIIPYIF
jgi:hypothetical protein